MKGYNMSDDIYQRAEDLVREQSLKTANRLHKEAQDEGNPVKYEQAAFYYEAVGNDYQATVCRMAADVLRR
jgi:hypothetical protein